MGKVRSMWFGLFSILLVFSLFAGPLAPGAWADSSTGGNTGSGQDISTPDLSGQMSGHDMSNMDGMDGMDGMDSSDTSQNGSTAAGGYGSGTQSGGHGESNQYPDALPNWPAIYGFGALNLLVIGAAARLKNKAL